MRTTLEAAAGKGTEAMTRAAAKLAEDQRRAACVGCLREVARAFGFRAEVAGEAGEEEGTQALPLAPLQIRIADASSSSEDDAADDEVEQDEEGIGGGLAARLRSGAAGGSRKVAAARGPRPRVILEGSRMVMLALQVSVLPMRRPPAADTRGKRSAQGARGEELVRAATGGRGRRGSKKQPAAAAVGSKRQRIGKLPRPGLASAVGRQCVHLGFVHSGLVVHLKPARKVAPTAEELDEEEEEDYEAVIQGIHDEEEVLPQAKVC